MESPGPRPKVVHLSALPLLLVAISLLYPSPLHARKFIPSYAGPYTAYVGKWFQCDPGEWDGTVKINVRAAYFRPHMKTLQTVSGNVTWGAEFNNTYWMNVKFDVRSNNQWKENAIILRFPTNGCRELRSFTPSYFSAVTGQPPAARSAPCVITPGTYVLDNDPIDWTAPLIPVLPYGTYRFSMLSGLKETTKLCTRLEVIVAPKQS